ncbi:MAG: hypothetical protein LKG19_03865 [Saprospiraceae bacterium]|jgi:hypothetical protein|nr:hypothetical protein [Saprospiraceae bacterium]
MFRLSPFNLIVLLSACAQTNKSHTNKLVLSNIYIQAIADFIKVANKKNTTAFDTLFIANRKMDQPEDFPDIDLPEKIENTQIVLITPKLAEISQKSRKSRIYINIMGWVDREKAEFIFVVFSNGFDHQYNYNINYKYNMKSEVFELENVQFNESPFGKK